jgi:hypothetical protein
LRGPDLSSSAADANGSIPEKTLRALARVCLRIPHLSSLADSHARIPVPALSSRAADAGSVTQESPLRASIIANSIIEDGKAGTVGAWRGVDEEVVEAEILEVGCSGEGKSRANAESSGE